MSNIASSQRRRPPELALPIAPGNTIQFFSRSDALITWSPSTDPQTAPIRAANSRPDLYRSSSARHSGRRSRADLLGRVLILSGQHNGCRMLQDCLDDGGRPIFDVIYAEVMESIGMIVADPSGNYLVQKLLEKCSHIERLELLVSIRQSLQYLSFDSHGTRVVQKLIELCSSPEETAIISDELRPIVLELCQDVNGCHCVQRMIALNAKYHDDYVWVYGIIASFCLTICTNRTSCCIYQKCLDAASGSTLKQLLEAVADNTKELITDGCGNYVLQRCLNIADRHVIRRVISRLLGSVYVLSTLKISSNVIERCMQIADEDQLDEIIAELCFEGGPSRIAILLCDPYANYCVQAALCIYQGTISEENKFAFLVNLVRPHLTLLQTTQFRRRILAKLVSRFPVFNLYL